MPASPSRTSGGRGVPAQAVDGALQCRHLRGATDEGLVVDLAHAASGRAYPARAG